MNNLIILKSFVSANVHRGVIRSKSHSESILMKGCVATAFLFVGLIVFGAL